MCFAVHEQKKIETENDFLLGYFHTEDSQRRKLCFKELFAVRNMGTFPGTLMIKHYKWYGHSHITLQTKTSCPRS